MLKKVLIGSVVAAASIAMVGCASSNNHFFSNPFSSNNRHASASSNNNRSTQSNRIFRKLERNGANVVQQDDQTKLVMPTSTNFRSGRANINREFQEQLNLVARFLKQNPYTVAEVLGNTDNTGSETANQALSERRAHAVIAYLESQGIPSNRLLPVGLSGNHPVANNSSETGRAQNRRVEITFHQEAGNNTNASRSNTRNNNNNNSNVPNA